MRATIINLILRKRKYWKKKKFIFADQIIGISDYFDAKWYLGESTCGVTRSRYNPSCSSLKAVRVWRTMETWQNIPNMTLI